MAAPPAAPNRPRTTSSTTPILFPSGEDANPLNRRLPAEVVTRRRPTAKPPVEKPTEEVQVDLKTYLTLRPEARIKWLTKAMKMAEDGKTSTTDLFDIISSRKFSGGIPSKVGRKLWAIVLENSSLFSDKQQRYLRSEEWVMTAKFGGKEGLADRNDDKDDEEVDDVLPDAPVSSAGETASKAVERQADPDDGKGMWTSVEETGRKDLRTFEDSAKRSRREAFERMERNKWIAEEAEASQKRELQQQQDAKRQAEEEADSSLMLLDRLSQRNRAPSEEPAAPKRDRERERDRDRHKKSRRSSREDSRDRRRGMSRSRSISIKRSPSRKRGRGGRSSSGSRGRRGKKRRGGGSGGDSLQDLIRKRMAEREAEMDSTRVPVVDIGHAQRWN